MAQPNLFKFYLRKWDGVDWYYYTVLSDGTVFETLDVTPIKRAPDGWIDFDIELVRGFVYYGMYTNISPPIKLYKDGATILRHIYAQTGVESKCQLHIEQLNRADYTYDTDFITDLDFSTYADEYDHVSIGILEAGFQQLLKAKEDTVYEIELQANPDVRYVFHDGIKLNGRMRWVGLPNEDFNNVPTLSYIDTEGTNLIFTPFTQEIGMVQIDLIENRTVISQDVVMNIDYSFYLEQTSGVAAELHIQIVTYPMSTHIVSSVNTIYIDPFAHFSGINHLYNLNITETITLPANHGAHIRARMWSPSASAFVDATLYIVTSVNKFDVTASWTNRYYPTYCPTLKASDLFQELVDKITEDSDFTITASSTLLTTTLLDQIAITSGDGLMDFKNSKIKTSLKDFFMFMRSKFAACMYFDETTDTLHLEEISNVFDGTAHSQYATLGDVKTCRVLPFTEEMMNVIKIGQKTYEYDKNGASGQDVTNGKDEFNQETQWETPLSRIKKQVDYLSPYRTDMYGIEFERINLNGKKMTDSSANNEVFALHTTVNHIGNFFDKHTNTILNVWGLYRKAINLTAGANYWEIENIVYPETAYNIIFSPVRSLLRNGNWFRSLLKPYDAQYIKFTSSGKTNQTVRMVTSEGTTPTVISEDTDILISSLCRDNALLFSPNLFDIEIKDRVNLYNLMRVDRYAYLSFTYLGNTYAGYIISVKTKPAFMATTKFRLLAIPTTDLEDFIR